MQVGLPTPGRTFDPCGARKGSAGELLMDFVAKLRSAWAENHSLVCVGLDPDMSRLPEHLLKLEHPIFEFNRAIVEATADLVCAYKPQMAYYAAAAAEAELQMTIQYIHTHHPAIPVILDAKRGDVGSTARMYAREVFDRYEADAATVNPYLGLDALEPFLERPDKGVAVLCRTSNPGARDLQDLLVEGRPLYQVVAAKASQEWNGNGNVLLVVGATYPRELGEIRAIVGDMPLLVPGVGAQGGDVRAAVIAGKTAQGAGMIISSSRGILYASRETDFQEAARRATEVLRAEINRYR